jgi:hypothetical protein
MEGLTQQVDAKNIVQESKYDPPYTKSVTLAEVRDPVKLITTLSHLHTHLTNSSKNIFWRHELGYA